MDGLGKDSMCHDSCFRAGARVRAVDAAEDGSLSLSKTRQASCSYSMCGIVQSRLGAAQGAKLFDSTGPLLEDYVF